MEPRGARQETGRPNKRQRSRNFTKYEKEVFYSVLSRYAGVINDKRASPDTVREAWNNLLAEYNNQPNVFPRSRRQLQVLWRDEKFRAKKRGRREQAEGREVEVARRKRREQEEEVEKEEEEEEEEEEERGAAESLLTPLLEAIKQEQEALSAEAGAAAARRSSTVTQYTSSPSPDLYVNSNTEEGPPSPLPVETQLDSCSSASPRLNHEDGIKLETTSCTSPRLNHEDDEDRITLGTSYPSYHSNQPTYPPSRLAYDARPPPPHHCYVNGVVATCSKAEEREREYHRARMTQLREEGAARLRLLEAELALLHQERHSRQQEHQLRVQILMERLRRLREEHT